jgi:hypothetical protein
MMLSSHLAQNFQIGFPPCMGFSELLGRYLADDVFTGLYANDAVPLIPADEMKVGSDMASEP